jgi:hypothetical protein
MNELGARFAPRRGWAMLFFLPVAFFAAEWWLRQHGLPYWLWFNLDPSYLYLLGGMHILEGLPPVIFEHPGVPVQELVAGVIWLSDYGTPGALGDAAFSQAEAILARASTVMLALDAAALWLLGWVVWRRTGALLPALFVQTTPFLTMLALKFGIEVEPEPLLLFAVLWMGAGLIEENARPSYWTLLALALAAAFGTATKSTFAPLGLAPLILIAPTRRRLVYVALAGVALLLFLLPEAGNLSRMSQWYADLVRDSGTYGRGPATVIDWARYPHAFIKLFFARPIFLAIFAACLAALIQRMRERKPAWIAMSRSERGLTAILAAQLAQMLLVAKHPSAHYVLPALELSGVALAFLWLVLKECVWVGRRRSLVGRGMAAALGAILVAQSFAFIRQDREMRRESGGARSIDLAKDFPACAHIYDMFASAPAQAWFYNHSYGSNRYAARLKAMLPENDYFRTAWTDGIQDWDGKVSPRELLAHYPCVVLRGTSAAGLENLAATFGPAFDHPVRCTAGSETILVEGAECPKE